MMRVSEKNDYHTVSNIYPKCEMKNYICIIANIMNNE